MAHGASCEKVARRLGHRPDPAGLEAADSLGLQLASAVDAEASFHRFPIQIIWNFCSFNKYSLSRYNGLDPVLGLEVTQMTGVSPLTFRVGDDPGRGSTVR